MLADISSSISKTGFLVPGVISDLSLLQPKTAHKQASTNIAHIVHRKYLFTTFPTQNSRKGQVFWLKGNARDRITT